MKEFMVNYSYYLHGSIVLGRVPKQAEVLDTDTIIKWEKEIAEDVGFNTVIINVLELNNAINITVDITNDYISDWIRNHEEYIDNENEGISIPVVANAGDRFIYMRPGRYHDSARIPTPCYIGKITIDCSEPIKYKLYVYNEEKDIETGIFLATVTEKAFGKLVYRRIQYNP